MGRRGARRRLQLHPAYKRQGEGDGDAPRTDDQRSGFAGRAVHAFVFPSDIGEHQPTNFWYRPVYFFFCSWAGEGTTGRDAIVQVAKAGRWWTIFRLIGAFRRSPADAPSCARVGGRRGRVSGELSGRATLYFSLIGLRFMLDRR